MQHLLDSIIPGFADSLSVEDKSSILGGLSGKFYVYVHMYPDGRVFYVGKGQGNRINAHEAEARKGVKSKKCSIIRKIWAEGGQMKRMPMSLKFFSSNSLEEKTLPIYVKANKALASVVVHPERIVVPLRTRVHGHICH